VGRILDAIDEHGLTADTLVIFTTDHGPAIARAKHMLYDPGLRTALMIRWPGLIAPGQVSDALLSNVDLLPTMTDLIGIPAPSGHQGHSFHGLLSEDAGAYEPRSAAYAAQTWGRRSGLWYYSPARCIRTAKHKLIRNDTETPPYVDTDWLGRFGADRAEVEARYGAPSPAYELYDLVADPWELHNIAGEPGHAHLCDDLDRQLTQHLTTIGDQILEGFVPNREGHPDVPLWESQSGGSYRLRAYRREEGSDVPFGERPRRH
jgi:arylsulfatase A-like enzyme